MAKITITFDDGVEEVHSVSDNMARVTSENIEDMLENEEEFVFSEKVEMQIDYDSTDIKSTGSELIDALEISIDTAKASGFEKPESKTKKKTKEVDK